MKFLPSFLTPKERQARREPSPAALREDVNPSDDPPVRKNPETGRQRSIGSRPGVLELPGGVFVQTIETVRAINRALLLIIIALAVAVIALAIVLMSSRDWITVYVPPDVTRGSFITAGTPSPAAVYGFASTTLQALYHWPADGEKDYPSSVESQAPYLTASFRRQLLEDHSRLVNRAGINELRGRSRTLSPIPERLYSPDRVVRSGDGVWSVTLDLRVLEIIGATRVKDIVIRYELRVVQSDVDPAGNVWGMQLDGFLREPVRIDVSGGR